MTHPSRDILRKLSAAYGFTPEEWHYRLAEHTSAMTVIGLFRKATFQTGLLSEVLIIPDEQHREQVKKRFMRQVALARGTTVTLYDPPRPRDCEGTLVPEEVKERISATKRRQMAPKPAKVDGRTTALGKQRMRAASRARWAKEKARAKSAKYPRPQDDAKLF